MQSIMFSNILILLSVALIVSYLFIRFKIPSVVGFIIAGIIIGPHGLGLVSEIEIVKSIAEIGFILLMFTIGIEFAPARLFHIGKEILFGGSLQVLFTGIILSGIAFLAGLETKSSFVTGFVLSLSSTAVVLKILTDRGEIYTPHGKLIIGISLFQDLCVIPAMILLNLADTELSVIAFRGAITLVALFVLFIFTYYAGRFILGSIARTMSRELFTIAVILVGLGIPWLASLAGATYSLGAFIAGLGLSRCEYSNQIETEIFPFRDVFNSIFFMSMGMLVDVKFIYNNYLIIFLLTICLIFLKFIITFVSSRIIVGSFRTLFLSAFALANAGEFSLVFLGLSMEKNIISKEIYQLFLTVSSFSMLLAPLIINLSGRVVFNVQRFFKDSDTFMNLKEEKKIENHVIICGYGVNGRNLSKVLKAVGLKYVILDINPSTVKSAKLEGEPIIYGDVTRSDILQRAGIETAKMIVFAISDPVATRRAVWTARYLNEKIYILVRTRFVNEVEELYKSGANSVIPEEFETSIEIFAHVLKEYRIPDNIIAQQIQLIRRKDYEMLRVPQALTQSVVDLKKILLSTLTESIYIDSGHFAENKTIEGLDLRKETGASIIAVVREGNAITNPQGNFKIKEGDVVILIGSHAQLDMARKMLIEGRG